MGQHSARPKLQPDHVRKLKRQVSFTEEEIKEWYDEFCQSSSKRHDDLFLHEGEFVKVYNSVYQGQSQDFAQHVFRTFDLDGDGKVDFREFILGLSFSGSSNLEKKLKWAFRVYDVNRDGYISNEEMRQIFKAAYAMIGEEALKRNGINQPAEEKADDIFCQMDKDGDGRITWEEFHDGAYNHPHVLELLECAPPE